MSANAYEAYLKGSMDNWTSPLKFTNINDNELYIKLSGDFIHQGAIEIKPYIIINNGEQWRGPDEATVLSVDGSNLHWSGAGGNANWIIPQNANAQDIYVYIKTNDNPDWWAITALVVEKYSTVSVSFSNSNNWSNVYLYTYINEMPFLTGWPGNILTETDGIYRSTFSVPEGTKIIFNNGSGEQTDNLDLVNNGCYNASGITGINATLGAYGYTTFASECPLDLDNITNATAFYVAATPTTSVKLVQASGTVQAGEGLVLYGEPNTEITIPVAISGTSLTGNLLVGCPTETTLNSQTTNYSTIYVLVNTDERPEFQNVYNWIYGGNTVTIPAGKAYLQALTTSAPSFSLEFDDETTGIANIERTISDNQYYTLDGRRVAQPTKGLYIVDGKKVIIK